MDYVLPNDVPWKWASKPYKKARKAVLGAEKKMWKSAYKGMMKNYTSPLYDTVFFPSNGEEYPHPDLPRLGSPVPRQDSFSPVPPMPRHYRKKRSSTRGRYNRKVRRFIARKKRSFRLKYRGKPAHVKRARAFKPVFSLDAVAKGMRRPKSSISMRPKVDYSSPPYLHNLHFNRVENWGSNRQNVFSHVFLTKSIMDGILASHGATDHSSEQCVLTECISKITVKNMTNTPVEMELYRFSYKKDSQYSIDQLWEQGLDNWSKIGSNTGFAPSTVGLRPQMSPRLMSCIKLNAPVKYRIGGGGSIDFVMKMKGARWISRGLMDELGDDEYMKGYTYGFLMLNHGTVAVDDAGTSAGYSSGRVALVGDGHLTFRVSSNNTRRITGYDAIPQLVTENIMNVESDAAVPVATA